MIVNQVIHAEVDGRTSIRHGEKEVETDDQEPGQRSQVPVQVQGLAMNAVHRGNSAQQGIETPNNSHCGEVNEEYTKCSFPSV